MEGAAKAGQAHGKQALRLSPAHIHSLPSGSCTLGSKRACSAKSAQAARFGGADPKWWWATRAAVGSRDAIIARQVHELLLLASVIEHAATENELWRRSKFQ